jgi:polyhydroxyalkanoate synthase
MSALHGVLAAPMAPELGLAEDESRPAQGAVLTEASHRLADMLAGIDAWRRHPYRRCVEEPPVLWSDGATRLLDYGQCPEATAPNGPSILVIPSMINRAYVLDLSHEQSFLRDLAAQGIRPLLIDWGDAAGIDQDLTLDTLFSARLRPILAIARVLNGGPVPLLGYCMGGVLAAALAANAEQDVKALITIGAPWDFDQRIWVTERIAHALLPDGGLTLRMSLRSMGFALGAIPNVVFQSLFAQLDPTGAATKFRAFNSLDQESEKARHFVAVEDWLNDGPAIPTAIAEAVLVDWHLLNTTGSGTWTALGRKVELQTISCPSLCFCAPSDRIAPLPSAQALPQRIQNAETLKPDLGHVGMVVSSRSHTEVRAPLMGFLKKL